MGTTPARGDRTGLRWGILGTANIAAGAFLPALAAAGGRPVLVGSRNPERAAEWARVHGIAAAVRYEEVIESAEVDAVYVALPNDQHVQWASRAAAAGKAVLCEKPLTLSVSEVAQFADLHPLIWESFVFPFHPQTRVWQELLARGAIGAVLEVQSEFHFVLRNRDNIRLSPERGGGALLDVGCYPIRLARLLFGQAPVSAQASGWYDQGVDLELAAIVDFPGRQRLVLSAGFRRGTSTFTRVLGEEGELRISNPFHPMESDGIALWRGQELIERRPAAAGSAFEHAIRHIQRAVAGLEVPQHTVALDGLAQAQALDLVQKAMQRACAEEPTNQEGAS